MMLSICTKFCENISKAWVKVARNENPETWPGVNVVVVLLFYVHGKHLRSCPDGQLT